MLVMGMRKPVKSHNAYDGDAETGKSHNAFDGDAESSKVIMSLMGMLAVEKSHDVFVGDAESGKVTFLTGMLEVFRLP